MKDAATKWTVAVNSTGRDCDAETVDSDPSNEK